MGLHCIESQASEPEAGPVEFEVFYQYIVAEESEDDADSDQECVGPVEHGCRSAELEEAFAAAGDVEEVYERVAPKRQRVQKVAANAIPTPKATAMADSAMLSLPEKVASEFRKLHKGGTCAILLYDGKFPGTPHHL